MSAMDTDTHPNPQPNLHHRKIDLQSHHDLTYLQTNLAQSALQKLDLHFPKISKPATHISLGGSNDSTTQQQRNTTNTNPEDLDEEDPMRRRVHDLISSFLLTTWRTATPNIAVNGTNASTLPLPHTATLSPAPAPSAPDTQEPEEEQENVHFQYSPFDGALQHKLASLHGELEALTAQVSKLRRTAPGQGADMYASVLRGRMDEDDARFARELNDVKQEEVQGLQIDEVRQGWNEDVREVYERGVHELAGLAGGSGGEGERRGPTLTETVGKAQRARRVVMELD